jgi:EpsI family protein
MVVLISQRGEPVVVKTNLENLPMEIAGFKATEDFFSDSVYNELKADKHVYRHYKSVDGKKVDLYIGYYGTAKGGRTGHNPYACLPGAGWGIVDSKSARLKTTVFKNGAWVNSVLAQKGDVYETVLHWYQSAGTKVLSTGIQQNIERFLGRVFYNRNDGSFVRITVLSDQQGLKNADSLTRFFAEKVLDLLPQYWPVER